MRAALALFLLLAPAAQARPVVLELFTSQACSSCPPADALLTQLAKNPHILALSFNVTYWNSPAWTDPYSLTAATDRQSWYAGLENSQEVYTPEAVIDGAQSMTGSDQQAVTGAIAAAAANPAGNVPITITGTNMITIHISAAPLNAEVRVFGYDSQHTTHIAGGENGGATLTETNIVRSINDLGPWMGQDTTLTISRPAGQHIATILQTPAGAVVGAAAE